MKNYIEINKPDFIQEMIEFGKIVDLGTDSVRRNGSNIECLHVVVLQNHIL